MSDLEVLRQDFLKAEQLRVATLDFPVDPQTTRVFAGWCCDTVKVIISFITTDRGQVPWETPEMKAFIEKEGRPCWDYMYQFTDKLNDDDEPCCVCMCSG